MIQIGLTGWGDHPSIAAGPVTGRLQAYSAHFPMVELDATFYAIPAAATIQKWLKETPITFQFIVKAYQGITGHLREPLPYESEEQMMEQFRLALLPMQQAKKLAMILIQFPPWFDCTQEHVQRIRWIKEQLDPFPLAIEFRHQSWYSPAYRQGTLQFLQENQLIHTVCDEPQAGEGSVPAVVHATHSQKAFIRLHGRNVYGWVNRFGDSAAWRKVRYLYEYSCEELEEIEAMVRKLTTQSREVFVVFNNNSGKHAAGNAKQLQQNLQLDYSEKLAAKQLDLFEGEW